MKFEIAYTKKALADLDGISDYIADVLKEPSIARNLVTCILQSIRTLEEMPMRHHLSDDETLKNKGLRIMPVKNYLIAYIPDEKTKTVYIVRILYGGRDISKQLNDTL